MYNQKVMDYFLKPINMGDMPDADGVGEVGNVVCGDVMHLFIRVGKNPAGKEVIADVKFKTLGCVAAIATSSIATELAKGKTLEQAMAMTNQDVVRELGGLPPVKVHCSVLAVDALKMAIYDYLKKQGRPIPEKLEKEAQRIRKDTENAEAHTHPHVE
ncbi:MAG TPA: iron-sulfur cluster assembly scaffold protein [archaeon]|nr:iron-sulfur cluster assembly scaffold protein [archaeon]